MEVEEPEDVAARLKEDLNYVPPERLIAAPDCGMKYLPREVAYQKLRAMVMGVSIVNQSVN